MTPDIFAAQTFLGASQGAHVSGAGKTTAEMAARAGGEQAAAAAAREFESFFLARAFESMQTDLDPDGAFGGGAGERAWRGPLADAYAAALVQAGGVGLGDQLKAELLALQAQETA